MKMTLQKSHIHPALRATFDLIYTPCKFSYTSPVAEAESKEYGGYTFEVNKVPVRFRVAKITSTKIGQFVTIWKRSSAGTIQPFDESDRAQLYVISVRKDNLFGQFVFSKTELCKQGLITNNGKEGKRAFRVYPPWDVPTNSQAHTTQQWQILYFLEITPHSSLINAQRIQALYSLSYHTAL